MAEIINFLSARPKKKNESRSPGLTDLLQQAVDLSREAKTIQDTVSAMNLKELKRLFETRLQAAVLERRMLTEQAFLCGLYISNLLLMLSVKVPTSWYATDYLIEGFEKSSPSAMQQGGDICFAICAIFPERGNWRQMNPAFYREAGVSLYYHYYTLSGREIGYHMSSNFSAMAEITKECVRSL